MVEAGLGISSANSLIAESFAGDVVALPIEPLQSVDIGMAIPAESVISPAARNLPILPYQEPVSGARLGNRWQNAVGAIKFAKKKW